MTSTIAAKLFATFCVTLVVSVVWLILLPTDKPFTLFRGLMALTVLTGVAVGAAGAVVSGLLFVWLP